MSFRSRHKFAFIFVLSFLLLRAQSSAQSGTADESSAGNELGVQDTTGETGFMAQSTSSEEQQLGDVSTTECDEVHLNKLVAMTTQDQGTHGALQAPPSPLAVFVLSLPPSHLLTSPING
jgi:hypothetical protein